MSAPTLSSEYGALDGETTPSSPILTTGDGSERDGALGHGRGRVLRTVGALAATVCALAGTYAITHQMAQAGQTEQEAAFAAAAATAASTTATTSASSTTDAASTVEAHRAMEGRTGPHPAHVEDLAKRAKARAESGDEVEAFSPLSSSHILFVLLDDVGYNDMVSEEAMIQGLCAVGGWGVKGRVYV